jgi:hypothetical protein
MNSTKKIISILMFAAIIGCLGLNQKDNFESFKESISTIQPNPSKVSDVALLIEKSEADYLPDLTLNTGIIDKYMQKDTLSFLDNKIQSAAILGIYSADIAYNLVFYQRNAAFESFSAAKIIANELGFGDVYVDNLFARYEEEDFSVDSMLIEFDKGLSRFNPEDTDVDRLRIIIGFIIGNYIEKQYQYHATIQSYKEKDISDDLKLLLAKEFILVALNQEASLDAILLSIEKNQYADDPGYFYQKFSDLKNTYNKVLPLKEKLENLSPKDVFQNPQFDELYFQIKAMRDEFALSVEKEII